MAVPFFVAFSGILLLGRYLPFWLPPIARAVLAPSAAGPAPTARCAVSVAVAGLALLVMSTQCSSCDRQCPAEVAMEGRALWFNSAAMFLGMVLGGVAVAMPPPHAGAPPIVPVAVDHLTWFTETVAVTAFAHDVCVFFKVVDMAW
ncbi:hypothetical protein BAE44_0006845 [Dichanthelium oligosanthes]|uniref:Uncharacterized protein n=1 Tax=Dichanthelium oligosanthes TaxID=888268 RepID=A0A1E5W497_9POAL|nr:hypothetical protein BAE44_0006845 [Dichanthelium oligosanthes]